MPLFDDTSPEAARVLIEAYRRMSWTEKLQRVCELSEATRQLARARIVSRYGPEVPEREIRLRIALLSLDSRTMRETLGWDPDAEGR